jgi:thiol:disulfide interchange protein DsbD
LREKLKSEEVTVTNPKLGTIDAVLNYQVCKEVCINQEKNLRFLYPGGCCSNIRMLNPEMAAQEGYRYHTVDSLAPSLGKVI